MDKNVLCATAEQKSQAGANEKRRRENAANCAGTKRRSSSKDFKNKDDGERLPQSFAAQDPTYRAVTVTADLWVEYSESAYDYTTDAHFCVNRRGDVCHPFFDDTQQPANPRREQTHTE